jgi:hypothetical protein
MKIVCINNSCIEKYLTINKTYEILSVDKDSPPMYFVNTDTNEHYWAFQSRFVVLKEYRSEKLKRIFNL